MKLILLLVNIDKFCNISQYLDRQIFQSCFSLDPLRCQYEDWQECTRISLTKVREIEELVREG